MEFIQISQNRYKDKNMSVNFVWEEKYSVGNSEIDNQHKIMFRLSSSMPESLQDGSLKRIIMDLYKYTMSHFKSEEALMKKTGYPLRDEHTKMHDDLVSGLNDIVARPFKNDEDLMEFKKFVYEWVIEHILDQDKRFFDFVRKNVVDDSDPWIPVKKD